MACQAVFVPLVGSRYVLCFGCPIPACCPATPVVEEPTPTNCEQCCGTTKVESRSFTNTSNVKPSVDCDCFSVPIELDGVHLLIPNPTTSHSIVAYNTEHVTPDLEVMGRRSSRPAVARFLTPPPPTDKTPPQSPVRLKVALLI